MTTREARIDSAVHEYLAHSEVTGLAIAVAQQGQVVFCSGYGVQDLDTLQPVTPATLFHLASVVKTMTSTNTFQIRTHLSRRTTNDE